jgi:hypothetical protein
MILITSKGCCDGCSGEHKPEIGELLVVVLSIEKVLLCVKWNRTCH